MPQRARLYLEARGNHFTRRCRKYPRPAAGHGTRDIVVVSQECFQVPRQVSVFDDDVPIPVTLTCSLLIVDAGVVDRIDVRLIGVVPVAAGEPYNLTVANRNFNMVGIGEDPPADVLVGSDKGPSRAQ